MNKEKILFLILALLFALISIPYVKPIVEGFSVLTPGMYPISSDVPILYEDYPLKKTIGVSNNTYADNYPNYPIFDSSYEQKTNNVRYWSTPNNGLCSPADFCNGIYDKKKIDIPQTPNGIPMSSQVKRVNYYGSHELICPTTTNID